MSLLSIQGLSVRFGERRVIKDVDLSVCDGEFIGLLGPNGAGKTSLLRAIVGLLPSSGEVRVAGRDFGHITRGDRARMVAYLAQDRHIAWDVPVEMVVGLGRSPYRQSYGTDRADDNAAVERAMERMEVAALGKRAATELSGGETARVLIARALAQETPLLLADEPVAGLDPAHQIALMRLFKGLAQDGKAVIASLHDVGLAARWCTRLIVLNQGQVVADGEPNAILTDDLLRDVYGVVAVRAGPASQPFIQIADLVEQSQ